MDTELRQVCWQKLRYIRTQLHRVMKELPCPQQIDCPGKVSPFSVSIWVFFSDSIQKGVIMHLY
jgi:hypothetical protein